MADSTLRPQVVPPEIEEAGGFGLGLELAFPRGQGLVQPVGPVAVFLVAPLGLARSEVQIFFPIGISMDSRHRLMQEFRQAWPDAELYRNEMPFWLRRDFDRRALFEAIATRGPLPPGAPPQCERTPLPWRPSLPTGQPSDALSVQPEKSATAADSEKSSSAARTLEEHVNVGNSGLSTHEEPGRGRFPTKPHYLHEVGYVVLQQFSRLLIPWSVAAV
jgi:hypothetical protein